MSVLDGLAEADCGRVALAHSDRTVLGFASLEAEFLLVSKPHKRWASPTTIDHRCRARRPCPVMAWPSPGQVPTGLRGLKNACPSMASAGRRNAPGVAGTLAMPAIAAQVTPAAADQCVVNAVSESAVVTFTYYSPAAWQHVLCPW
jgi:hypothetical protein